MNKEDFVEHICANFECNKEAASSVVTVFTESLLSAIAEGKPVNINKLGSFKISRQSGRKAYNSKTINIKKVPSYNRLSFIPAKELKSACK